ncbi:MAG: hypothetical protein JNJ71_07830 [Rubrivivax sp.]|jgi:chromosome segregation ATPase|nr:hypothetical protein [Rubrivivax sp.]
MNIRHSIATAALALIAGTAFAQTETPRVDQRQERQEQRIEQGKSSGELNRREARRLERQQAHIANAEERAKADGTVTKAERARLHHKQDHASARIARQKHDAQHAPKAASAPGN